MAKRLELAVKIDKHELSEEEATAQFTAFVAQLAMQASAQQQAAMADFGNRLERAGAYLQPADAPPPGMMPPPATCVRRVPNMVTCN